MSNPYDQQTDDWDTAYFKKRHGYGKLLPDSQQQAPDPYAVDQDIVAQDIALRKARAEEEKLRKAAEKEAEAAIQQSAKETGSQIKDNRKWIDETAKQANEKSIARQRKIEDDWSADEKAAAEPSWLSSVFGGKADEEAKTRLRQHKTDWVAEQESQQKVTEAQDSLRKDTEDLDAKHAIYRAQASALKDNHDINARTTADIAANPLISEEEKQAIFNKNAQEIIGKRETDLQDEQFHTLYSQQMEKKGVKLPTWQKPAESFPLEGQAPSFTTQDQRRQLAEAEKRTEKDESQKTPDPINDPFVSTRSTVANPTRPKQATLPQQKQTAEEIAASPAVTPEQMAQDGFDKFSPEKQAAYLQTKERDKAQKLQAIPDEQKRIDEDEKALQAIATKRKDAERLLEGENRELSFLEKLAPEQPKVAAQLLQDLKAQEVEIRNRQKLRSVVATPISPLQTQATSLQDIPANVTTDLAYRQQEISFLANTKQTFLQNDAQRSTLAEQAASIIVKTNAAEARAFYEASQKEVNAAEQRLVNTAGLPFNNPALNDNQSSPSAIASLEKLNPVGNATKDWDLLTDKEKTQELAKAIIGRKDPKSVTQLMQKSVDSLIESATPNLDPIDRKLYTDDLQAQNSVKNNTANAAKLNTGNIIFSPHTMQAGEEAVRTAADDLVRQGLATKEQVDISVERYNKVKTQQEAETREETLKAPHFLKWKKSNTSASTLTDDQALAEYQSQHSFGSFGGILYVSGLTFRKALEGSIQTAQSTADAYEIIKITQSESLSEEQKAAKVFQVVDTVNARNKKIYDSEAHNGTADFMAQTGSGVGQFLSQMALPIAAGALVGALTRKPEAGMFAASIANKAQTGMFAGQYFMDAYMAKINDASQQAGYQSVNDFIQQAPDLAGRAHTQGINSGIQMAALSVNELLPVDFAFRGITKVFAKQGEKTFLRYAADLGIHQTGSALAETAQEELGSRLQSMSANQNSVFNLDEKGQSFSEMASVFLSSFVVAGGATALRAKSDYERNNIITAKMSAFSNRTAEREEKAGIAAASTAERYSANHNATVAKQQFTGDVNEALKASGWSVDNLGEVEAVQNDPLAVALAKKDALSTVSFTPETPETTQRVIQEYIEAIDKRIENDPDTISPAEAKIAFSITGGKTDQIAAAQGQLTLLKARLEAARIKEGSDVDREDYDAWEQARNAVDQKLNEIEALTTTDDIGNKADKRAFNEAMPVAKEMAAFIPLAERGDIENYRDDTDGNGNTGKVSPKLQILKAIYTLSTTGSLPTTAEKLTGSDRSLVFGKDSEGKWIIKNNITRTGINSTTAPLLNQLYETHEKRSIQDIQQLQQANETSKQAATTTANETNAGSPSNASGTAGARGGTNETLGANGGTQSKQNASTKTQVPKSQKGKLINGEYQIVATSQLGIPNKDGETSVVVATIEAPSHLHASRVASGDENMPDGNVIDIPSLNLPTGWDLSAVEVIPPRRTEETTTQKEGDNNETEQNSSTKPEKGQGETEVLDGEQSPAPASGENPTPLANTKENRQKLAKAVVEAEAKLKHIESQIENSPEYKRIRAEQAKVEAELEKNDKNPIAKDRQDKANTAMSQLLNHPKLLFAQREAEAARQEALDFILAQTSKWLPNIANLFDALHWTFNPMKSGGLYNKNLENGQSLLVISVPDMLRTEMGASELLAKSGEELLHSIVIKAGVDVKALWSAMTDGMKQAVLEAYPDLATQDDFNKGHEAVRFLMQGHVKISEEGIISWTSLGGEKLSEQASDNLLTRIRAALDKMLQYIKDNSKAFKSDEARAIYKNLKKTVETKINEINAAQTKQAEVVKEEAPKVEATPTPAEPAPQDDKDARIAQLEAETAALKEQQARTVKGYGGATYTLTDTRSRNTIEAKLRAVDLADDEVKGSEGTSIQNRDRKIKGVTEGRTVYGSNEQEALMTWNPSWSGTLEDLMNGAIIISDENRILSGHGRKNVLTELFNPGAQPHIKKKAESHRAYVVQYFLDKGMPEAAEFARNAKIPAIASEVTDLGTYKKLNGKEVTKQEALTALANDSNRSTLSLAEQALADANDERVMGIIENLTIDDNGDFTVMESDLLPLARLSKQFGQEASSFRQGDMVEGPVFDRIRRAAIAYVFGKIDKETSTLIIESAETTGLKRIIKVIAGKAMLLSKIGETEKLKTIGEVLKKKIAQTLEDQKLQDKGKEPTGSFLDYLQKPDLFAWKDENGNQKPVEKDALEFAKLLGDPKELNAKLKEFILDQSMGSLFSQASQDYDKTHTVSREQAMKALGRAQPLDEPIKTASGNVTTMGSILAGDWIASTSGEPQMVIGKYPQGKRNIYRITTTSGKQARATADHLWEAISPQGERKATVRTENIGEGWEIPVIE